MEAAPLNADPRDATPEVFTAPGAPGRDNEDAVVVGPGLAVVVDGAGVPQRYRAGCHHSVAWFSQALAHALATGLRDRGRNPRDALSGAISQVAERHGPDCDLPAGSPSGTVAAFRTNGPLVDYLVACDAAIGVLGHDGSTALISDGLIERAISSAARLRAQLLANHLAPEQVTRQVNDHLEGLRNHPDGFWIPQNDPAVARHAISATLARSEVSTIIACTDGITRAVDRLGLHTPASLVQALAREPAGDLVGAIRRAEAEGPHRPGKRHDDATLAVLHLP